MKIWCKNGECVQVMCYKSWRISDGKPLRRVIVDENGNVLNWCPNKEELKILEEEPCFYKRNDVSKSYTGEQLLNELMRFEREHGRPPTVADFANNPEYPNYTTYRKKFGSWLNALKLTGLDAESTIKRGIIVTNDQRARLAEIAVRDSFNNPSIDLAGENSRSPCDGICPNGKTYEVKSSGLSKDLCWHYNVHNKYKEEIEYYYILAFNEDWTNIMYAWRIPGEMIGKDRFRIWLDSRSRGEFTVENMKEFDITEKIREVLKRYGLVGIRKECLM